MSENIVWSWKAARFLKGEVLYTLHVQYAEETAIQIGTPTKELNVAMTKTDFRNLLEGFQSLPTNASFNLIFYVIATDDEGKYQSEKETMSIYSYGEAVSSVVTPEEESIVLDITEPTAELTLLTWSEARLGYNETITYGVYALYNSEVGRAVEPVEVAKGLTERVCTLTVDEWNELAIAAGAPESVASDLQFTVKAFSESYPDGVPSTSVTINITTYTATYPDYLYIPGSHQGWDEKNAKGMPHSTLTKGLFEAYVDLTTKDGSDVEFKFNPDLAWSNNDFGINGEAAVNIDADGNVVVTGTLGGDNKNVKVPSGFYRLSVNKKLNTLEMLKIESMGIIGNATPDGWDKETSMVYDAETQTYSIVANMVTGEYKFRANNNWAHSIGNDGTFSGGNYTFDKADGEYKIVLDVSKHPYTVKILSTEFPERLYLPGSHQGWSPATAPTLGGNGEGLFEGGVYLVDANSTECQWKFAPKPAWEGDFGGTIILGDGYGEGTYGVSDNIVVPNGYYYIEVDMTVGTFKMRRIDMVGLIGGFNDWGDDEVFTYNTEKDIWTLTQSLTTTDEFKVRFNGGWDVNRGITSGTSISTNIVTSVYHNGDNMKVAADGEYTITLDLSTNPNTILIK